MFARLKQFIDELVGNQRRKDLQQTRSSRRSKGGLHAQMPTLKNPTCLLASANTQFLAVSHLQSKAYDLIRNTLRRDDMMGLFATNSMPPRWGCSVVGGAYYKYVIPTGLRSAHRQMWVMTR